MIFSTSSESSEAVAVRFRQLLAEAGSFGFQIHAFHLVLVGKLQEPLVRDLAADVILIEAFVQAGHVLHTAQGFLKFRIGMASFLLVDLAGLLGQKLRKGVFITYQ